MNTDLTEKQPGNALVVNEPETQELSGNGEATAESSVESSAESKTERTAKKIRVLGEIVDDVIALIWLTIDCVRRRYKEIPIGVIVGLVIGIAYVVSPIDLLPDPIPILGQLDDAVVLALILRAMRPDLTKYRQWKATRPAQLPST